MAQKRITNSAAAIYGRQKNRYLELVQKFPLRPIRSEKELDQAIAVIDALIDQESLNDAEQDYLDILGDIVEAFETKHYPDEPVSDSDMLQSLLEDWRISQAEVSKATGIAESTISEVLSDKRKLNRKQIGKLSRYFHVSPAVFEFGE
jgi:HTH-type transcriptional regulator/antitoxin HigA